MMKQNEFEKLYEKMNEDKKKGGVLYRIRVSIGHSFSGFDVNPYNLPYGYGIESK